MSKTKKSDDFLYLVLFTQHSLLNVYDSYYSNLFYSVILITDLLWLKQIFYLICLSKLVVLASDIIFSYQDRH